MGGIGRIIGIFILTGFLLALLRVFNFDVFAVGEWIFDIIASVVSRIADWFANNETFRRITATPSVFVI